VKGYMVESQNNPDEEKILSESGERSLGSQKGEGGWIGILSGKLPKSQQSFRMASYK